MNHAYHIDDAALMSHPPSGPNHWEQFKLAIRRLIEALKK